ncbi:MAG TPA: MFS transporter [Gaiellaceae bacterium]|jgi:MFS family permease|nr:MFS transporter [Gaiellaceae bacterium]
MPRPLEGRYWATAAIVLLALSPNIVVSTAFGAFQKTIEHHTGLGPTGATVVEELSNAGYAFGALVGGDLTQRFKQRYVFLSCEALFVAASLLAAFSWGAISFSVGRVLQGLATGFLLTAAIPPLVQLFPARKLQLTAALINVGFFGAVTTGPLLAGPSAIGAHHWRWFFAGIGLLGCAGLALAAFSLPTKPPPNPELPPDWPAFGLAALGTVAPFVGVGLLVSRAFSSPGFTGLVGGGTIALVTLLVLEYRKREPLSPVRPMSTSVPVLGTLVASIAGAIYVTLLVLDGEYLAQVAHDTPLTAGDLTWPQVVTVVLAASIFYVLVRRRSRHIATFVLLGLLALAAAGGLLTGIARLDAGAVTLGATALLGFGAGATVSPALWLAGWATPVKLVGRVFALIELIRSEVDYVLAPIMRHVAHGSAAATGLSHGFTYAIWLTFLVALAAIVLCVGIYLASGVRPERPDLETYLEGGEPGLDSPPFLARLRAEGAQAS